MRLLVGFLILATIGCTDPRRPTPVVASPVSSAPKDKQFDQNRALEFLRESSELLALIESNRLDESLPVAIGSHRFEVITSIWRMGAYESIINDLGGPRAIDVAYLLLREIDCHTVDDIPHYYALVREEFTKTGDTKPHEEIRYFLHRALAKRNKPNLISLE